MRCTEFFFTLLSSTLPLLPISLLPPPSSLLLYSYFQFNRLCMASLLLSTLPSWPWLMPSQVSKCNVCVSLSVCQTTLLVCVSLSVCRTTLLVCVSLSVCQTTLHVCVSLSVCRTALHVCVSLSVWQTTLHVCVSLSVCQTMTVCFR